MNATQAAREVVSRGVDKFWTERLREMLTHVETTHGSPNGNRKTADLQVDRVAKSWPVSGSVFVTRSDGKRFRLYMKGSTFKAEEV